jgi:NAD(P)-dependent dehydrogenase (short-subunit alcohol dehydrogenase family)
MYSFPVALVTGANQGIGFEIANGLAAEGFTVLVGARDLQRGQAAASTLGGPAVALQLDVTDGASIAAAAGRIMSEFGRLDVLVQNAGIATAPGRIFESGEELAAAHRPSVVPIDDLRTIWETNVFGVLAVYQAMVPILRTTPGSSIINVSSGLGSLTLNSDANFPLRPIFDAAYAASKTALNALTVAMAIELEADGINVNAVSPGHTKTRLTGYAGTETPEEGAAQAVRIALLGSRGPSGTFTHATMGVIPW